MPTERISVNTKFGLLDDERNRWGSFATSMVTNVTILILLLIIGAIHHQVVVKKMQAAELLMPVQPPKPPAPVVPKVKVVAPPQPKIEVARVEPPKIQPPKPEIEPPKPVKLDMPKPSSEAFRRHRPRQLLLRRRPRSGCSPAISRRRLRTISRNPQATMGGFGDPHGVAPNPNANRAATIAALGSFNAALRAQERRGRSPQGYSRRCSFRRRCHKRRSGRYHDLGAVASAGFANGVVGGTGKPGGHGLASRCDFGNGSVGGPGHVQLAQDNAEPAFTPPVVISEPKARYTPEAQQARVQGEVTLQVRFLASGQVEVIARR